MSYTCSSVLACPTCGIGCNYNCTSQTPTPGSCVCEETTPGNGACDGGSTGTGTGGTPTEGGTYFAEQDMDRVALTTEGPSRGPRQEFVDTDAMDFSGMPDSDQWSNHPGFIGGTWLGDIFTPKKNETKRYNDEYASQKAGCSYESGDSCVDLQDCKNYFQGIYNSNTGNSRVPKRKRKAASTHMGKVNNLMNARDCDVSTTVTSSIDQSQTQVSEKNEELIAIRQDIQDILAKSSQDREQVFGQAQGMIDDAAKKAAEQKKMYMMVGGGLAAVLLLVVILK